MKLSDLMKFQERWVKTLDQKTLDNLVGATAFMGADLKVGDRPYIAILCSYNHDIFRNLDLNDANERGEIPPITKKMSVILESEFDEVEKQCIPSITPIGQRMSNGARYPELYYAKDIVGVPPIIKNALVCNWDHPITRFVSEAEWSAVMVPKSLIVMP